MVHQINCLQRIHHLNYRNEIVGLRSGSFVTTPALEKARGDTCAQDDSRSRVAKYCSKTAGDSDWLEVGGEVAEEGGFVGEAHAADGVALSEDFKNYFN